MVYDNEYDLAARMQRSAKNDEDDECYSYKAFSRFSIGGVQRKAINHATEALTNLNDVLVGSNSYKNRCKKKGVCCNPNHIVYKTKLLKVHLKEGPNVLGVALPHWGTLYTADTIQETPTNAN